MIISNIWDLGTVMTSRRLFGLIIYSAALTLAEVKFQQSEISKWDFINNLSGEKSDHLLFTWCVTAPFSFHTDVVHPPDNPSP